MRRFFFHFLLILYLVTGCTTHSNTPLQRNRYAFMTRYNVYHHAKEIYEQALKQTGSTQEKDSVNTDKMFDEVIRKCQKGIELYSIREKPGKRKGWQRDPKQRALQNRTEYNPFIGNCWLLMGKSYYQKQEYKEAFETFCYIKEHFKEKEKIIREAILWENKSLFSLQEKYLQEYTPEKQRKKEADSRFSYYHPYSFYFFSPQDSIYNLLYNTYSNGNIQEALTICEQFYKSYPEDPLTPSFLHVETLSRTSMNKAEHIPLHTNYPVLKRKGEKEMDSFSPLSESHQSTAWYLLFLSPATNKTDKELLFEISTINFFHVLQKQIDTEIIHFESIPVIVFSGFKTIQEIVLYQELIAENFFIPLFSTNSQLIPISRENYKRINNQKDLTDYIEFYLSEITGK